MTPKNAFSLQQMRHGAVLLNLLCLLYMFVGIAIICDDYFVSSLELVPSDPFTLAPSSFYPSPGARGVLWRTLLLPLSVSPDAA